MDTIYIEIKIKKSDTFAEELRDEGMFFLTLASALDIERGAIVEIDESNYKRICKKIDKKFKRK